MLINYPNIQQQTTAQVWPRICIIGCLFLCSFPSITMAQGSGRGIDPVILDEVEITPESAARGRQFLPEPSNVNFRPVEPEKWDDATNGLDYSKDWPDPRQLREQQQSDRARNQPPPPSNIERRRQNGTSDQSGSNGQGSGQSANPSERRESASASESAQSPENRRPPPTPMSEADRAWWGNFFKYLMIGILLLLVAFGIYKFVQQQPRDRAIIANDGTPITLENLEAYIHETDLDRFLRLSLEKGDYTQAVRIYYLQIIKDLSSRGAIRWSKDKTNRDYLRDMRNHNLLQPFSLATYDFERVWYGNATLDRSRYDTIAQNMKSLLGSITSAA